MTLKTNFKSFDEIITSSETSIAWKFGRLVARIDKCKKELQEKLQRGQGLTTLKEDDSVDDVLIGIKDVLGIKEADT